MTKKDKISLKAVEHVSRLANLKLLKKELVKLQAQLEEILTYIERLNQLQTDDTEPISQITGLENIFRQDLPGPSLTQDKALSSVKKKHHGFFKTEAIFDET